MDRVVCGDVGFGKTEVAVRAYSSPRPPAKQVAVLVPTTLLAEQHYRTMRDRFADWPLKVGAVALQDQEGNRGRRTRQAWPRGDRLDRRHPPPAAAGRAVRDLGLVIVDEEQRFGVRQKEALKALRANVHLLTLTATPIPRTLNMAMAGCATCPSSPRRRRTGSRCRPSCTPGDDAQLREAFQRELLARRPGVLCTTTSKHRSHARANREALVPEARIGIAHGRCRARTGTGDARFPQAALQRAAVLDHHRIGHRHPNANTIIINRADKFGLAQLHQLRGCVGRSHHRAYAYPVVPDGAASRRRAEAAGRDARWTSSAPVSPLATHDLEIRGAGELLGEGPERQMAEVGFSLYTELLERAVADQGRQPPDVTGRAAPTSNCTCRR